MWQKHKGYIFPKRDKVSKILKKSSIFILSALVVSGFFIAGTALAAATVTPASEGTDISIDTTSAGGSDTFTGLEGPVITENVAGDIAAGTHTITLPSGWEFNIASDITITKVGSIVLGSSSVTPGSTSFSFVISSESTSASVLFFGGLQVKPTDTTPSTDNMTYSGAGVAGVIEGSTNFGTLSTVPGTVTQLAFTTQPGGAEYGSLLSPQPVVKTQDQFGNNSTNGFPSNLDVTLTLSGSGDLQGISSLDIGTEGDNGTVEFTDLKVGGENAVGIKQLVASADGLESDTSDEFEITQKPLTATLTASDKEYDGSNSATITGVDLVGVVGGDTVSADFSAATATFEDENAGTGKTINATGITLTGGDAGNYTYDGIAEGTANITPRPITVTADPASKTYGEADPAELTYNITLGSLLGGDVLTGSLSRDAGENVGTYAITQGDLDNDNYAITFVSDNLTINQRSITVTAVTNNKVYDGNTTSAATPAITVGSLAFSDTPGFAQTYDNKNVGENKTLTPAGVVNDGNSGDNYDVAFENDTTGVITEKELTVSGLSVAGKIYDGNTDANISGTPLLVGDVETDDVSLIGTAEGVFNTANVGINTIAISGLSLTGADALNYILTQPVLEAEILQLEITGSFTTENKVYNGNTTAAVLTQSLDGVLPVDEGNVILTGGAANFADANVADGIEVTASDMILSGSASGNYSLTSVSTEMANISQKSLTATVTVQNKVVDGNNSATITDVELVGVVGDDDVDVDFSGAVATFADAAVGNGKAVTATGIVISSGNELGNYSYDGTATGTGEILPVPTTVYVDDDWAGTGVLWEDPDGIGGPATYFGYDAFATIQEAIDAVAEDGTVNVAAGTYNDFQVVGKNDIDIISEEGATITTAIEMGGVSIMALVANSRNIIINGLNFDGAGVNENQVRGIVYVDSTGSIADLTVNNINGSEIAIGIAVIGIEESSTTVVDLSGITVNNSMMGVAIRNAEVGLANCTITGSQDGVGIMAFDGATVNIEDCLINNFWVEGPDSGMAGLGIMIGIPTEYEVDLVGITGRERNSVVEMIHSTIAGNNIGIYVDKDGSLEANSNEIVNNDVFGILNDENATEAVDATENYWGTAVAATIDSMISGLVDYDPYYVNEEMTILSSTVPSTVYVDDDYEDGSSGGYYFGYDAFITIQAAINAATAGNTINVAAGTYEEDITVDKSLTLNGAQVGNDARGRNAEESEIIGVVKVMSDAVDVTFDGFKFTSPTRAFTPRGFNLRVESEFSTIRNNIFVAEENAGHTYSGYLDLDGITDTSIENNDFSGDLDPVQSPNVIRLGIAGAGMINVRYNEMHDVGGGGGIGITSTNVGAVINIENNEIDNTGDCIWIWSSDTQFDTLNVKYNEMYNCQKKGLKVVGAISSGVIIVNENKIYNITEESVYNDGTGLTVDATSNWWGTYVEGEIVAKLFGDVLYDPWYMDEVMSVLSSSIGQENIYVDDDYTEDLSDEGLYFGFNAFNTIQEGIDVVEVSGIVNVAAGIYKEDVNVNKSVTLVGDGAFDTTVIKGQGTGEPGALVISADDVTVEGFHVIGSGVSAIRISGARNNVTIQENRATAADGKNAFLTDGGQSNHAIENNTFDGNSSQLVYVNGGPSVGNPSTNVNFVGNTFGGSATGPLLGQEADSSSITDNVFSGSTDYAALEMHGDNNVVSGNDLTAGGSGAGILISGFSSGTVIDASVSPNTISGFGTGIKVEGIEVTVNFNEITGNVVGVQNNTGTEVNAEGNWWGTTNSVEIDSGITGDVDYRPWCAEEACAEIDRTLPKVDDRVPAPSAIGFNPLLDVEIVFSEDVQCNMGGEDWGGCIAFSPEQEGTASYDDENFTLTFTPTGSFNSNENYGVTLSNVEDISGNELTGDKTWQFTTATYYDVDLYANEGGWNLISLPVVPSDTSVYNVLGEAESDIRSVWTYDPTNPNAKDGWLVYSVSNSDTNNLTDMTAGYGYWIDVSNNTRIEGWGNLLTPGPNVPPSRSLSSGWNLIGYYQIPGEDSSTPSSALSSLQNSYTSLWGYNNEAGSFKSSVETILPGDAFWISLPDGGDYTPSNVNQ